MRRTTVALLVTIGSVIAAGAIVLGIRNGTFARDPFTLVSVFAVIIYVILGAILATRQKEQPIGWLFLCTGLGLLLGGASSEYATYALVTAPGSIPFGIEGAWIGNWAFIGLAAIPLVLLLFPTGHLPSPRWRWAAWTTIASVAVLTLCSAIRPSDIAVGPHNLMVQNPAAVPSLRGVITALVWISGIALLAASIASMVAVVLRYRRAVGEEKQQLRWLASVASFGGACLALALITSLGLPPGESSAINDLAFSLLSLAIGVGIPVAVTIALLKYRLYDLDLVIKKTVLYVVVAALVFGAFAAAALVIGGIFTRTPGALAIAASIAGFLVWPAIRLARRVADRIVYRGRATPYEALAAFGQRMSETYSTEDVLDRTAQLLGSATGATRAVVWLRVGRELRPAAFWPTTADAPRSLVVTGDDLPMLAVDRVEPVRDHGELLGALTVDMPANDPLDPSRERIVRDLAAQAGLALRNVRLIEELRASRQRLVTAQDEERRKLERNIHDGVQQQLVALNVQLGLLGRVAGPGQAANIAGQLQGRATEALEDLRDLARGIYPPLLADQGLAAAVEAQARKAAIPVTVETEGVGRYDRAVESTVYFCTLEALNNTAKYADASTAHVRIGHTDGHLRFDVVDDGRGFDTMTTTYGTGLQGMADRLDAIGGTLHVTSHPREGTRVTGTIPAAEAS